MPDLAIISDHIVTSVGVKKGAVLIKGQSILAVEDKLPEGNFDVIDVRGKVLMPGIIDPHVHINEPGRTNWEGFDTAGRASIAGGITTLVDMPLNSSPVTTSAQAFEEKLRAAEGQLHTNCGFWGGIIPGNETSIEPLIKMGVLGFKAFLTHSGIDEFPNVTEDDLRKVMPVIARHGLPVLVHCEIDNIPGEPHYNPGLNRSYDYYISSRPKQMEDEAIAMMIRLCKEFNCRTHIVHLSSANSIEAIAKAKQEGLPLTVETSQHYLYFNSEQIGDGKTLFKCAPPIRDKANNERLWQALQQGIIDFVATDHSPAPPEIKELDSGNLMKAWGGISSLQLALPVLWTGARRHNCELSDMVKWLCSKPAELAGLTNSKGQIAKGYDADLVIWDPALSFKVTEQMIHHKHKNTPYLHETLLGVVQQTWLAGKQVFNDGKFLHLNRGKMIMSSLQNAGAANDSTNPSRSQ